MSAKANNTQQINKELDQEFWKLFFKDDFHSCLDLIEANEDFKSNPIYKSKVYFRLGDYNKAYDNVANLKDCALKDFLFFLLSANPLNLLNADYEDDELYVYQAQALYLTRIFLGESFLKENNIKQDPDELIENCFKNFIEKGDYTKAILSSIQSIEIVLEEYIFSQDLQMPVILDHIENVLAICDKVNHSTKAKVLLLKGKLLKNKEIIQDAEILFGKDANKFGLAEVYFSYAKDFNDFKMYEKAKDSFAQSGSNIAVGYVLEALASVYLQRGEITEARKAFDESKKFLINSGIFEKFGLLIQEISLQAISGKYQRVKEAVHDLINGDTPSYFSAQAYQLLANTTIQLGESSLIAQGHIQTAISLFEDLKRYPQMLNAKNFLFQTFLLEGKVDLAIKLCNEIIHLASKLGNEDLKASKYMDLAYLLVRKNADSEFSEELIDEVRDNFKKAIDIFKKTDNFIGEAEAYQSMANIYASIGRLEDSLENFIEAKKLFKAEKAFMQSAITDVLIGVLLLSYVVLNEQSYLLTMKHFDQALLYFAKENLSDLHWKTLFFIADLNHKYYFLNKDKANAEIYKNKAKQYYLDMHYLIEDLEYDLSSLSSHNNEGFGVTIDTANDKAYQFFLSIGEEDYAKKFRKNLN